MTTRKPKSPPRRRFCRTAPPTERYETEAWHNGTTVVGIDEVGRGCLAGPVVTAAVALTPHVSHPLLKDSKFLSASQRHTADAWIRTHSCSAFGISTPAAVDRCTIYRATHSAMVQALVHLAAQQTQMPQYVLVDAVKLSLAHTPYESVPVISKPFGEQWSPSIAAASIRAKVYRDALMEKLAPLFPQYGFERHKGYGTKQHIAVLKHAGPSIIHRSTFIRTIMTPLETVVEQQTLWGL